MIIGIYGIMYNSISSGEPTDDIMITWIQSISIRNQPRILMIKKIQRNHQKIKRMTFTMMKNKSTNLFTLQQIIRQLDIGERGKNIKSYILHKQQLMLCNRTCNGKNQLATTNHLIPHVMQFQPFKKSKDFRQILSFLIVYIHVSCS